MTRVAETAVHQGGIYLVKEDLEIAHDMHRGGERNGAVSLRKVIIPAGEILEMRYHSPAHFRDVMNQYFPVDDSQLHKLEHVAEILEPVFRENVADLYDILRLRLYKEVDHRSRRTNVAWMERSKVMQKHFEGVYTRL